MPNCRHDNYPSASLLKQLAAMVYDGLLIFAILFVAVGITIPFNQGKAINPTLVYVFFVNVVLIFYSWFWRKSGQTLGMRAWKIQIISELGGYPDWSDSFLRLFFAVLSIACIGMGYWWRIFKPYTWHDKLSQTRVIDISKTVEGKDSKNSARLGQEISD